VNLAPAGVPAKPLDFGQVVVAPFVEATYIQGAPALINHHKVMGRYQHMDTVRLSSENTRLKPGESRTIAKVAASDAANCVSGVCADLQWLATM
jgi:hypothetical protein